ncbi:Hypothetical protein NTJ_03223 [Nesidiocoris tenuis]|uniref:Uncharacterized protein n=1 Tax=Nesidiocoris tenuis TaxID=355587 RepID=A0ABN7ADR9_9HEMI|nr:Hypothetical protein NTJ_03223 [Nesidiocoris tenuis]
MNLANPSMSTSQLSGVKWILAANGGWRNCPDAADRPGGLRWMPPLPQEAMIASRGRERQRQHISPTT